MRYIFFSFVTTLALIASEHTTQHKDANLSDKNATASNRSLFADTNISRDANITQKHLMEQLEREKKYAKEQKFYMGKEYNLTEHQVDQATVDAVEAIRPDYDFDITDVYRDDI